MRIPEEWLPRFDSQGSRPYRTRLTGRLAFFSHLKNRIGFEDDHRVTLDCEPANR